MLTFAVQATTQSPISQLEVYIDNVSIGLVRGPFTAGTARLVGLGVPTTLSVRVGQSYAVLVGGTYEGAAGAAPSEYWQSVDVVASSG